MLQSGDFAVSHWTVVVAIAAAFLVLQLGLSLRVLWRLRRHERVLGELCTDLEHGGDGRGDARWLPASFTWLRWAMAVFPRSDSPSRGAFSREEALAELDARLTGDADYLLLQRMGVMAPLLGVVLTVIGFFFLDGVESGEPSLSSILLAVAPLVSGVGAGAVLALVNQVLLHVVGIRIESLRTTARAWFDSAIWSRLEDDQTLVLAKAIGAMDQFATAVVGAGERHVAGSQRIEQSAAALGRAADELRAVAAGFSGEIKGVPQTLRELRSAISAAAGALEDLVPMGTRAVANLDVSVAAFRSTIDREFTEAARLHHRSGKELSETLARMAALAESFQASSDGLREIGERQLAELSHRVRQGSDALNAMLAAGARSAEQAVAAQQALAAAAQGLADSSGQLWLTMESDVAPAQRTMRESVGALAESAGQLADFIHRGLGPATRDLATLHETLAGVREAVAAIGAFSHARADIDRLTETLARAGEISDALAALPDRLREVVEQNANYGLRLAGGRSLKRWLPGRPR